MKRSSLETSVGIFMFIGIVCIGYLAIHLGKIGWIGNDHYELHATFQSVSGLMAGADVEMSGVKVGQIGSITLDQEKQAASVRLKIRDRIILTDDVIASVKTAGLIGDKYISLLPGGSDLVLKPGDTITETESAVDLEDLISKYIFGQAD